MHSCSHAQTRPVSHSCSCPYARPHHPRVRSTPETRTDREEDKSKGGSKRCEEWEAYIKVSDTVLHSVCMFCIFMNSIPRTLKQVQIHTNIYECFFSYELVLPVDLLNWNKLSFNSFLFLFSRFFFKHPQRHFYCISSFVLALICNGWFIITI